MTTKHDVGQKGYGIPPGYPGDYKNHAIQGVLVKKSSTGSSQVTGAGDGTYLYDLTEGIVHVDGTVKEIQAAKVTPLATIDGALEAVGDIMANGYSKVYAIIAWKNSSGVVAIKSVPGAAALTGAQVIPTTAEIELAIYSQPFVLLGSFTIARTGDTTVTEAVDNTLRPSLIPTVSIPS
jgi:hypothetical protein